MRIYFRAVRLTASTVSSSVQAGNIVFREHDPVSPAMLILEKEKDNAPDLPQI